MFSVNCLIFDDMPGLDPYNERACQPCKGIELLPQTKIFLFLYLCNLIVAEI